MPSRFLALLFILVGSVCSAGESWPEFRGPHGNGVADDAHLPSTIDASVVRWQTPIHGKGWSSPVVWGNQIWLTTATEDGKSMSVICVARDTGKIVHDVVVKTNESPAFCHPMNSYASPTPVIEAGRLYVHFGSYLTACLDTKTAEILWQRTDLECDHHRGPASSPIVYDGKLFVAYDGFDVQYVVAFDKQTGSTVWKHQRAIDYGTDNGDAKKAYGTAQIIKVDGQAVLVYPSAVATEAFDPTSGELLWTVYHGGMNASVRPLYEDGLLLITNGMGSMVAVDPQGRGNLTETQIRWSSRKSVAKKSSPLCVDGLLYMASDDGILSAREIETGDVLWQKRVGGAFAASPIFADGRIYAMNTDGEIVVFKPGRDFQPVSQTQLGDGYMASPAVVGDEMILRSKSTLYCIVE
ncbi:PQQ-binding-like beta-propeller repeat protein [Rhodopirellula sp. MGV]|uniref:outer membrane protein assembly factor BamB family protein n=1 Tax=Rhodopirellula sp. MGV TaxID=2023130 RepID=UPI000B97ADC0|nr:PQQ-binding-like beta-propeller repeat protein [Rhodopirellula sp. MGV]OYP32273.1 quinonprotein alcohol dehydrogenase [Rhodopirellula sp. MGV]PNY35943.1 quinonprotein alcohol dehydrogenase [Rhodopirellula baltica]